MSIELTIVDYQDGDGWVSRCLEYEFFGEGPTKEESRQNIVLAMYAEVEFARLDSRVPFADLTPTPNRFVDWVRSQSLETQAVSIDLTKGLNDALADQSSPTAKHMSYA